ncbi:glycosyltransferase family 4 protein [Candidatus Woesearchaeota archaeon]|nr:glycosyltransferase family 4 protein [Candidatus Woesearchaeota archaeon]
MLNFEFPPLGGGASPLSFDLAKEIVKNGHEVDVITMNFKNLKKYESIDGIHIHRVNCIRNHKEYSKSLELLSYIFPALIKSIQLHKIKKYDLNHTHFIIPTGIVSYLLKKITKLPYMITSHGSDVPNYNPDRFKVGHIFIGPIWKKIIDNSEGIITPSEYLKNLILKKYDNSDKIKVIPNGIKIDEITKTKKQKKIIYAGRLLERKGVQYIIEAIKDLDLKGYKFEIIGDGPYMKELEQKAKGIENILFKGWISQEKLKKIYEESEIFIIPSTQESFGMVIVEAMEKNMAVICGKGSACEEVIGKTGIAVDPTSSDEIKKALKFYINNPKEKEKSMKFGRQRVTTLFNIKTITKRYIEAYSRIIKTNKAKIIK